jgi:hypothetical protein
MNDQWSMFETETDGLPGFVRLRTDVGEYARGGAYLTFLRVVWEYEPDDDQRLPSDDVLEALDDFEDRLSDALEKDEQSVLVFVMTHDGARQWVFYSKDVEESTRRIDSIAAEAEPYPIETTSTYDPDWTEHRGVATAVGATTT